MKFKQDSIEEAVALWAKHLRLLINNGYLHSGLGLFKLLEESISFDNMGFTLQKCKAFLLRKNGKKDESLLIYEDIDKNLSQLQYATVLADKAIIHQELGKYQLAVDSYTEASVIFKELGNVRATLRMLNNLGAVLYQQKRFKEAVAEFRKLLKITSQNPDEKLSQNYRLIAENNLAEIFLHSAQWKRSTTYAQSASDSATKSNVFQAKIAAEIIAVLNRFAIGNHEDLEKILNALLSSEKLDENPKLLMSLRIQLLYIYIHTDSTKAETVAEELWETHNASDGEDVLLPLFLYFYSKFDLEKVVQLKEDLREHPLVTALTNKSDDLIVDYFLNLEADEDVWFQMTSLDWVLQLERFKSNQELLDIATTYVEMYDFDPLKNIVQAISETPAQLSKLWDVINLIHSKVNFEEVIEAVLATLVQIANLDRAVFYQYEDSSFQAKDAIDNSLNKLDTESLRISNTVLLKAMESNEPAFFSNLQEEIPFDIHSSIFGLGLRTAVCCPIRLQNEVYGVIYSDAKANRILSGDDKKLLESIFLQASSAFSKAYLNQNVTIGTIKESNEKDEYREIIGNSKSIRQIFEIMRTISKHNVNVLIRGETGTGKEIIAKAIHSEYKSNAPFQPVNCAAIPDQLLESELFGYKKGAFTGADSDKKGIIEAAAGGTLFLDEIGDMPMFLQAKLLRVVQERQVTPLGSTDPIDVEVRIISATHKNLEKAVQNNEFRKDLLYRLNVIMLEVPPLRDRREDIPLLVQHFVQIFNKKYDKSINSVSGKAMTYLQSCLWDGNIRELENEIERAILLSQSNEITRDMFKQSDNFSINKEITVPENWNEFQNQKKKLITQLEQKYIEKLLALADGKVSEASKIGGLGRTQLYRILGRTQTGDSLHNAVTEEA